MGSRKQSACHPDTWRVFRILAEFVEGFEEMNTLGPAVSIFGSARTKPDHPTYQLAVRLARDLVKSGWGIITGGGPGIMEAANRGAAEASGDSVGLAIELPFEEGVNAYCNRVVSFRYFFCRKVMFVKYAKAFIVLPGGLGTLDEMFEALTLIQTNKIRRFPVVLVGSAFWGGLVGWLRDTVAAAGNISPPDLDLFHVVDDPADAIRIVNEFYRDATRADLAHDNLPDSETWEKPVLMRAPRLTPASVSANHATNSRRKNGKDADAEAKGKGNGAARKNGGGKKEKKKDRKARKAGRG